MKQEDKELLLKDLSARLPYEVYAETVNELDDTSINRISPENINLVFSGWFKECKPYLRPMSSITDEEISDLQKINCQFCFNKFDNFAYVGAADDGFCSVEEMGNILDYLNSHHFDYRGLIEKGLALEAPEGMYNIKEK